MNEKTKAIIRLVVQAVLLFNMALTLAGKNPLAVDESALTDWLTTTVTAISSIWIWWKNNNVTKHAQYAQQSLNELKKVHIDDGEIGRGGIMKAMLSQPMAGKTDEEIIATREKAIKVLEDRGYEIVNTLFTDEWYSKESMTERGVVQIPLCFLAKSLENMSLCHAAYFCKGWENTRGCRLEHEAAKAYGVEIIYEE